MPPRVTEVTDEYYHVRYADPDEFESIRTPDWAEKPASSVIDGAEVRTGSKAKGDDSDWRIQSVLIPTDSAENQNEATSLAADIVEKIES